MLGSTTTTPPNVTVTTPFWPAVICVFPRLDISSSRLSRWSSRSFGFCPTASSFEIAVFRPAICLASALTCKTIAFAWESMSARCDVSVVEAVWNDSPSACAACASACRAPESSGVVETFCQADQKLDIAACRPFEPGSGSADSMPCQVVCRTSASPCVEKAERRLLSLNWSRIRATSATCTPWPSWPGVIMPHTDSAPSAGFAARSDTWREYPTVLAFAMLWLVVSSDACSACRPLSAMLRPLKVEIGIRPSHPAGRGCPRRGRRGPSTSTAPRVSACGRSRRSRRALPRSASG